MTGTNTFSMNLGSSGLAINSGGNVSITHLTANDNETEGLIVLSSNKNVTVTCGFFIGNGTGHVLTTGYGWATSGASSVTMIGTDAAGNYNTLEYTTNGGVTPVFTPRTCTIP